MEELTIQVLSASDPSVRTLKLSGPFTLKTVFEFQDTVRTGVTPATVIDLAGVPYMDSAALGAVLGFHASCQRENRSYVLTGVSERLRTLFKVAGVEGLLHIESSAAEAAGQ